jgi:hypothetical protein
LDTTSQTLLGKLKSGGAGAPDWQRFQQLYEPFIHFWLRSRIPRLLDEVEDLTQEVRDRNEVRRR